MKTKQPKPQQIPSAFEKTPAIDCNKPAFRHLKTSRSFVSLNSKWGDK